MASYIEEYARYLAKERNSSENTITSYVRDVNQFVSYLAETEEMGPEQCEAEQIEDYVTYMTGLGKSPASMARSVASLKSYYSYLQGRGIVRSNPAKGAAPVRTERKLPQILTGKEVELFLEQPDPRDAKGCRKSEAKRS